MLSYNEVTHDLNASVWIQKNFRSSSSRQSTLSLYLSCDLKSSSGLRCRTPGTKRPGRSSSAGPVILRAAEFGATKHTYTELCHNSCRKAVCVCVLS